MSVLKKIILIRQFQNKQIEKMRYTKGTKEELIKSFNEYENLIEVNNNNKAKKIFLLISIIYIIITLTIVFLIILFTVFKKAIMAMIKKKTLMILTN